MKTAEHRIGRLMTACWLITCNFKWINVARQSGCSGEKKGHDLASLMVFFISPMSKNMQVWYGLKKSVTNSTWH